MSTKARASISQIFAEHEVIQQCFAEMAFRYVIGTGPDEFDHKNLTSIELAEAEKQDYACEKNNMINQMNANTGSVKEAFIAIGLSEIVRYRKAYNR